MMGAWREELLLFAQNFANLKNIKDAGGFPWKNDRKLWRLAVEETIGAQSTAANIYLVHWGYFDGRIG